MSIFDSYDAPSISPRAARSIKRILDAAAKLFGAEGYQGASMGAVARAAGVSKGLLHYHFRSKEHLLIEAQRATFRHLHARFDDRFRRGERGMDTALEALDALWASLWEMRTWAPFMVETMSLGAQHGQLREHLDSFYTESEQLLERAIRDVFADHLDELAVPPQRLVQLVRVAVHGLIVELAYASRPSDLERIQQTYTDLRTLFGEVTPPPEA